jgi:hypothetical protein
MFHVEVKLANGIKQTPGRRDEVLAFKTSWHDT